MLIVIDDSAHDGKDDSAHDDIDDSAHDGIDDSAQDGIDDSAHDGIRYGFDDDENDGLDESGINNSGNNSNNDNSGNENQDEENNTDNINDGLDESGINSINDNSGNENQDEENSTDNMREIDIKEKRKVELFVEIGCGCTLNNVMCSSMFSIDHISSVRDQCNSFERSELNNILLGHIMATVRTSDTTNKVRNPSTTRIRNTTSLYHEGQKVTLIKNTIN